MASERRNRKKELLLLCVPTLMLRRGTGHDDRVNLCATKLSKGVFFSLFDSKKRSRSQVLQMFFESMNERLAPESEETHGRPTRAPGAVLDTMAEILASERTPWLSDRSIRRWTRPNPNPHCAGAVSNTFEPGQRRSRRAR